MRPFTLSRAAENDLLAIIEYIAAENPAAAVRVKEAFDRAFHALAETPGLGHYREELLDQRHRFATVYSYLIVYRWQCTPIQIIAIIHGARDLERQFQRRGIE